MIDIRKLILGAGTALLLTACDSDDNPGPAPATNEYPAPTAFSEITGTAVKGIIAGATVTVLDANGEEIEASAVTDENGNYTITFSPEQVASGIAVPLQIVVSSDGSATTVCDADNDPTGDDDCLSGFDANSNPVYAAFGETFALTDDFMMRAVLPALPEATDDGAEITVNPTPLTEIAAGLALGAGNTLSAADVESANAQVLALVREVTGVDTSDLDLTSLPAIDLTDTENLADAPAAALAAASVAAAVIGLVDPDEADRDTLAETVTALSSEFVARAQASGNNGAVPAAILGFLSNSTATVLRALAGRAENIDVGTLIDASDELAELLASAPDDLDAIIGLDGEEIDLGDFIPDGNNGEPATVNSDLVGEYMLVYSDLSPTNDADPFTDGQSVTVMVSANGTLTIGDNSLNSPFNRDLGNGPQTTEIIWDDGANNIQYALSNNSTGIFNEINVGDTTGGVAGVPAFLGQLNEADDGTSETPTGPSADCGTNAEGTVSGVQLLVNCAGDYTVDSTDTGTHSRGTITIAADGTVDFDTNIQLDGSPAVFDRLFIEDEPRIQANYGADDDGPTIQLFFATDTGDLIQIQYRNRNDSVDVVANVSPALD